MVIRSRDLEIAPTTAYKGWCAVRTLQLSSSGFDICAGAGDIETVKLIAAHDAFGDSHGSLFGHIAIRNLRFESPRNFSPRLHGIRHGAGGPVGVTAECKNFVYRHGMDKAA